MLNRETYIKRRQQLCSLINNGIVLLFGNNEPITTSTALPNINFSFRHMIEV